MGRSCLHDSLNLYVRRFWLSTSSPLSSPSRPLFALESDRLQRETQIAVVETAGN